MEEKKFQTKEPHPNMQQGLCLGQPPNGWLIYRVYFVAGQCGSAIGDTFCNKMDIINCNYPWPSGQILDISLQYYNAPPNGWSEVPNSRYHQINGCDNVDPLVFNRVKIQKN